MKYTIRHTSPHLRYIHIEAVLENITSDIIEIRLPAWRPGRYELGNFAKNVKNFTVTGANDTALPFIKLTKDLWQVQTQGNTIITISYRYFAATLDAGSTYTGESILYVNPVNCLVYEPDSMNDRCSLALDIPSNFTVACALPQQGRVLTAENFDMLADSPLIASPDLEHHITEVNGSCHHVWINGGHTLNVPLFMEQVKKYTTEQIQLFGHFPAKDYHYLIHMLPHGARHGVEHSYSTVIAMGLGNEFHIEQRHKDLLAICSHELFHFWNIKRIRPAAMWPYEFSKENYSALGYIYEGITTYYGDYMLLRSGVTDFISYAHEFSKDLQRHFENSGRYNYSVAESSFDTWLDGYVSGTPGRKVSIYIEGMLAALIADVRIRKATGHQSSLDTVMHLLYERFYMQDKGYTEENYRDLLEEVSGQDMTDYFRDIIWGRGNIEKQLPQTLDMLGLEMITGPSVYLHERYYGFKTGMINGVLSISAVIEGSPADIAGIALGDAVTAVNGITVMHDSFIDAVIAQSAGKKIELHTQSLHKAKITRLAPSKTDYFNNYAVAKKANATQAQKDFYKAWSHTEF